MELLSKLSDLSNGELLELQTQIKATIASRAGEALELVSDRGECFCPRPKTGYILFCRMAACTATSEDWYETLEAAQAALLRVANHYGNAPQEDLLFVDLTAPNCDTSRAWICSVEELSE